MPKRNNHYLFLSLLIAGLMIAGGCKEADKSSQAPPPSQSKARKIHPPVQKQQSSATVSTSTEQKVDFSTRKDPFKPFVSVMAPASTGSASTKELLPIQSFEISKFKVAGIIVGLKENSALVIDPSGKGYVVKQGMLIGNSDGQITRITATSIEVLEKYRAENGRVKSRIVKLTLPKKR